MRARAFKQVDVFTERPFLGNPVAVILESEGLDAATMQAIAGWTNLSETTFVLPASRAEADYAVRIFTPRAELPFAGHPTLGTAHAVIEAGIATPRAGRLVQQCALGLVDVTVEDTGLSFRLPRYSFEQAPDGLAGAIGRSPPIIGTPQIVDVGPRWVVSEFDSAAAIEALEPDLLALAQYDRTHQTTGLTIFAREGESGILVRTFAPLSGVPEDPVCGSGNGAVAAYRLHAGQVGDGDRYHAKQGRNVGRDGRIALRIDGTDVHVGGACVTCIDGTIVP